VPTFADRGCRAVSALDPHCRIQRRILIVMAEVRVMEPQSGKIMVIILNIFCVGYFFGFHFFLYTLYNVFHSRERSGSYMEKYGDYIKGALHLISFFILPSPLHCSLIFFLLLIFILCCFRLPLLRRSLAEKCAHKHPV
jgi:hypothetical protein